MKKFLVLSALLLTLFSCSSGKKTLHIYNWSDYIKEDLVTQFEKEFDCKVVMDFYDSNETLYAKLKAGTTGYDIVLPSGYMAKILNDQGMLEKIDTSLIPNTKNIDTKYLPFTMDEAMDHSVIYMVSNSGIGYLASKVSLQKASTWQIFGDQSYKGRMTMLNDMREALGATLKSLGYSLNSTSRSELEEARDVLITWKKNLAKFEADQYKNGLVSEEFTIVHGYNGDLMQVMEENEDIQYTIPIEGTALAADGMVILKGSKEKSLAHHFINFMLRPEVAAANIEYVWFLAPNIPAYALLSEEIKSNTAIFLPDDILAKCEPVMDLGNFNDVYSEMWDAVKAAE